MCDTLCVVGADRTLFAKNSDRPVHEVQLVEALTRRAGGGQIRTQYLQLDDPGAAAVLGSRPGWLWGLEHGVNEHRVAIGNEKIWTIDDPRQEPPALIGMDLVRLGLERARSADEALDVMTGLLERHGQGGVGDATTGEPYFSSFLIADPRGAWVLETSGRTWAARPVEDGAAISNRITLGTDWTRASLDVAPGSDFDAWRHPKASTGHADRRLDTTRACVARGIARGVARGAATAAAALGPADLVSVLRHHGTRAWGAPGVAAPREAATGGPEPPPTEISDDGTGVTVCMHIPGYQATAAAMVADLPADPEAPCRAWVAAGSPCVSVFVPVLAPGVVPSTLGDPATWRRVLALRERVERDGDALAAVRAVLDPLEHDLWAEADALAAEAGADPGRWEAFCAAAGRRLDDALARLA